jgi:hypothetical protein
MRFTIVALLAISAAVSAMPRTPLKPLHCGGVQDAKCAPGDECHYTEELPVLESVGTCRLPGFFTPTPPISKDGRCGGRLAIQCGAGLKCYYGGKTGKYPVGSCIHLAIPTHLGQ